MSLFRLHESYYTYEDYVDNVLESFIESDSPLDYFELNALNEDLTPKERMDFLKSKASSNFSDKSMRGLIKHHALADYKGENLTDDEKGSIIRSTGNTIRDSYLKDSGTIKKMLFRIKEIAIDKPRTWIMRKIQKLRNWADKHLDDIEKMPAKDRGIWTAIKKKFFQVISFLTSLLSEKGRNEKDIDYTRFHTYGHDFNDDVTNLNVDMRRGNKSITMKSVIDTAKKVDSIKPPKSVDKIFEGMPHPNDPNYGKKFDDMMNSNKSFKL